MGKVYKFFTTKRDKYEPHYDYFLDDYNTQNGGQRIATVLMYLTDVEEGGETVFPNAIGNHSALPNWDKLSKCGKGGRSVRPKTGDATFILAEKLHLGGLIGAGIIILGLYTVVWGKTKEQDLSSTAAHDEDNHKGISINTPQQLLPTTNPHVPCT